MHISRFRNCAIVRSLLGMRVGTRSEAGSALVEFVLTMPVLTALLVGAGELGWMTYASVEVANAARAGVSYGCQTSATAGDTPSIQNAAAADAPDITLGTTTVSASCICSDGTGATSGACVATSCSSSQPETILTVQTQATVTPVVRLPGLPTSFTLHGQAVQKVLQ
jgi:Flp pilus assembly protein TadG